MSGQSRLTASFATCLLLGVALLGGCTDSSDILTPTGEFAEPVGVPGTAFDLGVAGRMVLTTVPASETAPGRVCLLYRGWHESPMVCFATTDLPRPGEYDEATPASQVLPVATHEVPALGGVAYTVDVPTGRGDATCVILVDWNDEAMDCDSPRRRDTPRPRSDETTPTTLVALRTTLTGEGIDLFRLRVPVSARRSVDCLISTTYGQGNSLHCFAPQP